jgi:tetratricopeptide (TPR) repeat protein
MKPVQEESALSWVTIVTIIALVAVGFMGYKNKEKFFPSKKATPRVVKAKMTDEMETDFFMARDRIVLGNYDGASELLTALDTEKMPQPDRNWVTLQNGYARLLAGKLTEARAEFAKVEARGLYSADPKDEKLARFFVHTAHLAATEEPIKPEAAQEFDTQSAEAFALAILGMKDWALGQFDDGIKLLNQFKQSETPDTEIWIRRYKPVADAYAEAYAVFMDVKDMGKDATTTESKKKAIESLRATKARLKGQPTLVAKLTETEKHLQSQVDAVEEAAEKETASTMAADKQVLDDVKTRVKLYNEKFNFADGHQIVFTATVNGDTAKAELDAWFKRTQALSRFKSILVNDLSAGGYAKPVAKKDGTTIPGLKSADDSQVVALNNQPVPWENLTADGLLAMAKDFLAKNPAPDTVAERKWALGNFLYEIGKKPEAQALLREAAAAKPEYADSLKIYP